VKVVGVFVVFHAPLARSEVGGYSINVVVVVGTRRIAFLSTYTLLAD
jgi:hypothetical protein